MLNATAVTADSHAHLSPTPRHKQYKQIRQTNSTGRRDSFAYVPSPDQASSGKKFFQIQPIVKGKRVAHSYMEKRQNSTKDAKGLFVSHVNMIVAKKLNKKSKGLVTGTNCVLYPMGAFRQKWDMVILILLVYVSLMTPLQIAFFEQDFKNLEDWLGWFIIDQLVDAMFIIDIVLNFRTAWLSLDPEDYGRYIFNAKTAAKRYLTSWFPIDLLSVVPFYFIDIYLLYADVEASQARSIVRVPKMLKMIRLAKLLRVLRASQIFKRWDRYLAQRVQIGCTKLAKSMVLFIWMLHLLACLWYFAASFEDDIRLSWMSALPAQQQLSPYDLYLASLHWATMTLTTIGYGDIVPLTATERIICFVGQLMGVLVSAYVIGTVVLLVQSFIRRSTDFQRSMDAMQDFLRASGVSDEMRRRCTTYCFYAQDRRKSYSDSRDVRNAMAMFSPALRIDLSYEIHKQFFSDSLFFNNTPLPTQVLKQICCNFEPVVYGPHEFIARKGHFAHRAYFLTQGKVQMERWTSIKGIPQRRPSEILIPNHPTAKIKTLQSDLSDDCSEFGDGFGSFDAQNFESVIYTKILDMHDCFGLASLFWQCYWWNYYRALGFCELFMLRAQEFRKLRIYKEFPISFGVLKRDVLRRRWRQCFSSLLMQTSNKLQQIARDLVILDVNNVEGSLTKHSKQNSRSLTPDLSRDVEVTRSIPDSSEKVPLEEVASPSERRNRRNSKRLLAAIEKLAKQQGSMKKQLSALSKSIGSDNFTGTRSNRTSASSLGSLNSFRQRSPNLGGRSASVDNMRRSDMHMNRNAQQSLELNAAIEVELPPPAQKLLSDNKRHHARQKISNNENNKCSNNDNRRSSSSSYSSNGHESSSAEDSTSEKKANSTINMSDLNLRSSLTTRGEMSDSMQSMTPAKGEDMNRSESKLVTPDTANL